MKLAKRTFLIASGATLCLALALAWMAGTSLTAPARWQIGDLPSDLSGRSVEFPNASGATLRGWLLPGQRGAGIVVLMHGFRASRHDTLSRARFLSAAGYTVLLFDFQAHGESMGEHITVGFLESRDAQAAISFARAAAPGEKVGVVGVSMGGAATALASPPLDAQALVFEMVYPTIGQAIDNRLAIRFGSWARVLRPLLTIQLKLRLGISADDLRPVDRVRNLTVPKLFIAGAEDRLTTLEESNQLFDAASEPKEFWVVEGAGHVDLHALKKQEYERRILDFFENYLRR